MIHGFDEKQSPKGLDQLINGVKWTEEVENPKKGGLSGFFAPKTNLKETGVITGGLKEGFREWTITTDDENAIVQPIRVKDAENAKDEDKARIADQVEAAIHAIAKNLMDKAQRAAPKAPAPATPNPAATPPAMPAPSITAPANPATAPAISASLASPRPAASPPPPQQSLSVSGAAPAASTVTPSNPQPMAPGARIMAPVSAGQGITQTLPQASVLSGNQDKIPLPLIKSALALLGSQAAEVAVESFRKNLENAEALLTGKQKLVNTPAEKAALVVIYLREKVARSAGGLIELEEVQLTAAGFSPKVTEASLKAVVQELREAEAARNKPTTPARR